MDRETAIERLMRLDARARQVLGSTASLIESGGYVPDEEFGNALILIARAREPLLARREVVEGEEALAVQRQLLPLTIAERLLFVSRSHTSGEREVLVEMCEEAAKACRMKYTVAGLEISDERAAQIIASEEMPGTRANPLGPGATSEEIDALRAAWSAADPLTQEQRNEMARRQGLVVERDDQGHVIDG